MKFWKMILNKAKESAEILIYEQIGKDFWSDEGIAAKDFAQELKALGNVKNITLRINSPGGSVFEGLVVYNLLRAHQAAVTVYIDGIAASIASVIAMSGDKIIMPDNALLMIHDPFAMVMGTADDMRKMAEALDKIKDSIKSAYKRTMMTDDELTAMMTEETWLSASEAVEKGFADEIIAAVKVAACFDLSAFKNAPQAAVKPTKNSGPDTVSHITITQEVKNMKTCKKCGTTLVEGNCPACMAVAKFETDNKNRMSEIKAIGEKHKCVDLAVEYIQDGRSVQEFKDAVIERISSKQPAIDTHLNLSAKEQKKYSYARAMAVAAGVLSGGNSFELEISNEIKKNLPTNYKDHGGLFVPLVMNAGLDSETSTAGSEYVFTQFGGELIELLRKRAVVAQLGARVRSGLSAPIAFPRKTGEGAAHWVGENPGSDDTDTDDTTETVTLSPKSLTRSTSISRQLLIQSAVDADADVRDSISNSISLAIDQAGLHGTGANNQPTGIYAASNVNAKAMGGVPTFGKLVDMITEVANDNAIMGTLGWATTPGMAGKLMQTLVASAAGSSMIWSGKIYDGIMAGYKAIATNQVKSTLGGGSEHGLIFGNFVDLLIGLFGGIEIVVDPYAKKKQAMIEYTIFAMADVMLRHPESFCKATGATIT